MPETITSAFVQAMKQEKPLQIPGVVSAYNALQAEKTGFRALYISGAGVANSCHGLPDLGMTTLTEVCEEIRRIRAVSELPLLVDADTGFGDFFAIQRTVREMSAAGASACHIEDQVSAKRCGHRPGKRLVDKTEMCDRIKAACDARTDSFQLMARTDACASEGLQAAIERAAAYVEAGADMIFAEALTSEEHYREFCQQVKVPVLANMTEFGRSPLLDLASLEKLGLAMVLYPLSAFRAMSRAAQVVFETIRQQGDQRDCLDAMQTRDQLYEVLDYHSYEQKQDRLHKGESS